MVLLSIFNTNKDAKESYFTTRIKYKIRYTLLVSLT